MSRKRVPMAKPMNHSPTDEQSADVLHTKDDVLRDKDGGKYAAVARVPSTSAESMPNETRYMDDADRAVSPRVSESEPVGHYDAGRGVDTPKDVSQHGAYQATTQPTVQSSDMKQPNGVFDNSHYDSGSSVIKSSPMSVDYDSVDLQSHGDTAPLETDCYSSNRTKSAKPNQTKYRKSGNHSANDGENPSEDPDHSGVNDNTAGDAKNRQGASDDDQGDAAVNARKKKLRRGAIASTASAASKSLFHLQLLMFLKQMMMLLMMLMQAAVHAVVAAATAIVQTIISVVVTVVQVVATALGVSVIAAAAIMFPVVGIVAAGVTAVVLVANQVTNPAYYEPAPPDCKVVLEDHVADMERPNSDHSALQIEAAKTINSVLHTYANADPIHVAGILGNAQRESGIDPTSVQSIYSEPFFVGAEKLAVLSSPDAANHGLGIFQWTFSRHTNLRNFADERNMDWYDIGTQMAYMLTESSHSVLDDYLTRDFGGSLQEATIWFDDHWERSGDTTGSSGEALRVQFAENWLAEIINWEIDTELGDSIIDLAGSSKLDSENSAIQSEYDKCVPAKLYECDSIASAAVSYAWLSTTYAKENEGTPLYRCVHDAVFPGDPYYRSCDRGAATAIRWSGADDRFPAGACTQQLSYCLNNPSIWAHVGAIGGYGNLSLNDLKPGDLLICDGCHTLLHTGHEIIEKIYPDKKSRFDQHADVVTDVQFDNLRFIEANFGHASPHCIPAYSTYFDNNVDEQGDNPHTHRYEVFRCQTTTLSQTYKDAAANIDSYR